MSTNSTFIKSNSDGSFSIRYHHWDGYPGGVGEFLSTVVNTQKKVDWLFDLNRGFSTMMRSKPDQNSYQYAHDEYAQNGNVDWPKLFASPQTQTKYIATMNDPDSWSNSQYWHELENWAQEYNYIWENDRWNIILHYGASFSQCVFIDVPNYIKFSKMLSELDVESSDIEFSWEFWAEKMECSQHRAQSTIEDWQKMTLDQRIKIFEHCLNVDHSENNFVEQLDAWVVSQKLQQSIVAKDTPVKKSKL